MKDCWEDINKLCNTYLNLHSILISYMLYVYTFVLKINFNYFQVPVPKCLFKKDWFQFQNFGTGTFILEFLVFEFGTGTGTGSSSKFKNTLKI